MKSVFLLQHIHEISDGEEDVKIIGIYSSLTKAEKVVEYYKTLPGFKDYSNSFNIDEYKIDQNHWGEGFFTIATEQAKT